MKDTLPDDLLAFKNISRCFQLTKHSGGVSKHCDDFIVLFNPTSSIDCESRKAPQCTISLELVHSQDLLALKKICNACSELYAKTTAGEFTKPFRQNLVENGKKFSFSISVFCTDKFPRSNSLKPIAGHISFGLITGGKVNYIGVIALNNGMRTAVEMSQDLDMIARLLRISDDG